MSQLNRSSVIEFPVVGSVKTNIGHLEAAAGIAGLIKATLALHHRHVPSNLNFESPNPEIDFDGLKLQVASSDRPWPDNGHPPRAGVNSFGFGGTNAHAVLEAAPAEAVRRGWPERNVCKARGAMRRGRGRGQRGRWADSVSRRGGGVVGRARGCLTGDLSDQRG